MEVTPELIEQITQMVLQAVRQTGPEREQLPAALLIGSGENWMQLEKHFELRTAETYEGTAMPYRFVLVDELPTARLTDLALGRDSSLAACAVSKALLEGVPVYLAEEALPHRRFQATANPSYYAMLEGYVTRLEQFGVRVMPRRDVLSQLTQVQRTAESKEPAAAGTSVLCGREPDVTGVLTADQVQRFARQGKAALLLAKKAKVTPLARDVIREKGIRVEWLEEN